MGIPDYPVIYDLPRAIAVKRFDEFGRYVHPVLQNFCVRCHNDGYEGSFQLISFKSKLDRTPAALLSNLDATLKLVDRENPAHSVLLSSSLRPHGNGPNPRPIFKGSNDAGYQILASWINRLQSKKTDGAVAASMRSAKADSGETFASQRRQSLARPRPWARTSSPLSRDRSSTSLCLRCVPFRASTRSFPTRTPIPTSSPFLWRPAAQGRSERPPSRIDRCQATLCLLCPPLPEPEPAREETLPRSRKR